MKCPIYIFTGPEVGERSIVVSRIKTSLVEKHKTMDFHNLYADSTSVSQVLSLLQTGNLFMQAVCVVLNGAEEIKKKEEVEQIIKWASLEQTFPAILILLSDEISINKAIESAVPKEQKQIFWELFENKKKEWIRSFFAKEKIKITDDGIEGILELVENNTDALKTACMHISLFFDEGATIKEENIEQFLSHTKEETVFTLFDAITHANLTLTLTISQKLMSVKNTSPIQLIAGLTYCFKRLADWHSAIQEAGGFNELTVKKVGFTSKTAITQYTRAAKNFSFKATMRILTLLNRYDYDMRASGTALQNIILDRLLYFIVAKKGFVASEYRCTPYKVF